MWHRLARNKQLDGTLLVVIYRLEDARLVIDWHVVDRRDAIPHPKPPVRSSAAVRVDLADHVSFERETELVHIFGLEVDLDHGAAVLGQLVLPLEEQHVTLARLVDRLTHTNLAIEHIDAVHMRQSVTNTHAIILGGRAGRVHLCD